MPNADSSVCLGKAETTDNKRAEARHSIMNL